MTYILNSKDTKHGFDCAGAAEKMTQSTLGAANIHIRDVFLAI